MIKHDSMSIQDIADALGVSKSTVSRVISGKGRIGSETREKVLRFIEDINYRPNSIAKGFSESKTYNVGVVLPMDKHLVEMPFFQACLLGISEALTQKDYDVIVVTTLEDDIPNLKRIVENKKVDGIIITRLLVNDLQVDYLESVGIPYLVIGAPNREGLTFIDSNNRQACMDMTQTLLSAGYQRLGLLLGSSTHVVNQLRAEGFKEAHKTSLFPMEQDLLRFDLNEKEEIDQAVDQLLLAGAELIICGDDYICTRVISYRESKKRQNASAFKIASFYNSQVLESLHANVPVVDFDIVALGREAGEAILKLVSQDHVESKLISNYHIMMEAQHEK